MMCNKLIATLLRSENAKVLLRRRYTLPETFYTSKYNTDVKSKNDPLDDELDKPIKYSTSKAATWPATVKKQYEDRPTYQAEIIGFSFMIFYIYFTVLREESDIDQNMVKDMPIEVQEQLYGKKNTKYT